MRRSQLLTGFLLMVGAAFVRHVSACGLFGVWVARGLHALLGGYGTTLLAVALAGAAIVVAMPAVIGRTLLVASKLAVESASSLATRTLAKVRKARLSASTRAPARTRRTRPAKPTVPDRPPLPREGELRGALRHLGFTQQEVESVVPRLDSRGGIEGMLRQALSLLRSAA